MIFGDRQKYTIATDRQKTYGKRFVCVLISRRELRESSELLRELREMRALIWPRQHVPQNPLPHS